jgi:hypothetical protein
MNDRLLVVCFFMTIVVFFGCDKQFRVAFDKNRMEVSTCDHYPIREIKVFNIQKPEAPLYKVSLKNDAYGVDKLSLTEFKEGYHYSYQDFKLEGQSTYEIIIPRGHTTAIIEFTTDSKGKIRNVKNLTPCLPLAKE